MKIKKHDIIPMNVCNALLRFIPAFFLVIVANSLVAQTGLGIGIDSPHPSAILHLADADNKKGLLVPRMTSIAREAIVSPADGLLVYDTDQKMFYHFDAGISKWQALNPFSYQRGTGEDNFVMTFANNKSFVIGNVSSPIARLEVDGDIKNSGNVAITNSVSAATITTTGNVTVGTGGMFQGHGTVPLGSIIMWSGQANTIPDGWALCNGQVTAQGYITPDLRRRFVVGYDDAATPNDYTQPGNLSTKGTTPGSTGGLESVTLTTSQLPSHSHTATASSNGGHTHVTGTRGYLTDVDLAGKDRADGADGSNDDTGAKSQYAGSHTHTITVGNTGGGQPHENRPPYYVLAFIMRVK